MTSDRSRIAAVVMLLLAGILAGAQFGKIAPLVGWYHDVLGLSLTTIGWLAALIGFFVAFAAFPSAFVIDRFGGFRVFAASSAVLFAGGLGIAALDAPDMILAARLVEGVGYLFLVVVIPTLAAEIAPPPFRGPALAVWGGFVPIGFAVADFAARAAVPLAGVQGFLWLMAGAFALFALPASLLLWRLPRNLRAARPEAPSEQRAISATFTPALLCNAAGFGCYVVLSLAFFTFLPAFGEARPGIMLLPAGAVALLVPLGNALAGALVGGRSARFVALLIVAGFGLSAAVALPLYAADAPLAVTAAAVLFAISGGVIVSAQFALIPFIVPPRGSSAAAMGFVAQCGGIATLIAPPLAGHLLETFGWPALGVLLCLVAILGMLVMLPLIMRRRP